MSASSLFSFPFRAMASPCVLHLYGDAAIKAELAAELAMAEVQRIEQRYSRYRPDSELSRINTVAAAGGEVTVDAETAGLISYAYGCFEKSGGLFDITSGLLRRAWDFTSGRLPAPEALQPLLARIGLQQVRWQPPQLVFERPGMELDFGGIGKEYAADQAAAVCRSCGIVNGLVDLGGDMVAIGPHPDGEPWRIGIRHPRLPDTTMAEVVLHNEALASSGDYERCIEIGGKRYCHILDPRTGWPCEGLAAVSVLAPQCLVAGTVATTAMLKGRDGIPWLAATGLRHLTMDDLGVLGGNAMAP